jgi:hypothetical protein
MPTTAKMDNMVVFVNISNEMFAGQITGVLVNGYDITDLLPAFAPVNFPLNIGNGTQGQTNQIGTYSILVKYTGVSLNAHISISDSDSNYSCQNIYGDMGNAMFYSQVVGGSLTDINITANDADCP